MIFKFKNIVNILVFIPVLIYAAEEVVEPEKYKLDQYRSPTPQTLSGAIVVDAEQAMSLHKSATIKFIDVLPAPKQPEGMTEDDIWLPKQRFNIPDSIWLADVGYGVLSDEMENYFVTNLDTVTKQGYRGYLFYCQVDCWMSWNAAKRAIELGYSGVYWFPGGVDEWSQQGFQLAPSQQQK